MFASSPSDLWVVHGRQSLRTASAVAISCQSGSHMLLQVLECAGAVCRVCSVQWGADERELVCFACTCEDSHLCLRCYHQLSGLEAVADEDLSSSQDSPGTAPCRSFPPGTNDSEVICLSAASDLGSFDVPVAAQFARPQWAVPGEKAPAPAAGGKGSQVRCLPSSAVPFQPLPTPPQPNPLSIRAMSFPSSQTPATLSANPNADQPCRSICPIPEPSPAPDGPTQAHRNARTTAYLYHVTCEQEPDLVGGLYCRVRPPDPTYGSVFVSVHTGHLLLFESWDVGRDQTWCLLKYLPKAEGERPRERAYVARGCTAAPPEAIPQWQLFPHDLASRCRYFDQDKYEREKDTARVRRVALSVAPVAPVGLVADALWWAVRGGCGAATLALLAQRLATPPRLKPGIVQCPSQYVFEYQVAAGLWLPYGVSVQEQLNAAYATVDAAVHCVGGATIDLDRMEERQGDRVRAVRVGRAWYGEQWCGPSVFDALMQGQGLSPEGVEALATLCSPLDDWKTAELTARPAAAPVVHAAVADVLSTKAQVDPARVRGLHSVWRRTHAPTGARPSDSKRWEEGIDCTEQKAQVLQLPSEAPAEPVLELVRRLPQSGLIQCPEEPVATLLREAAEYWAGFQLRRSRDSTLRAVADCDYFALFTYSFELKDDDGNTLPFQIYSAINKVLREFQGNTDATVSLWRPIIWHIQAALEKLPAVPAKVQAYRGITVFFDRRKYARKTTIHWHQYSSASLDSATAKNFLATDRGHKTEGSLFILRCRDCRYIMEFSRYPEEEEMLFDFRSHFKVKEWLSLGTRKAMQISDTTACINMWEL